MTVFPPTDLSATGTRCDTTVEPLARLKLSVLVVEDCAMIARLTVALLSKLGYDVHLAIDGDGAVAACVDREFSVILMDMEMPGMSGAEATASIRYAQECTGVYTPIIGYSASARRSQCLSAGMDDFLQKPASCSALAKRVSFWGVARAA